MFIATILLATYLIDGRTTPSLYHCAPPADWVAEPQNGQKSLDSTLPLIAFSLPGAILVTIHNFPSPIPPLAQVERWKKQFPSADPFSQQVEPISWSGFGGLRLEIKSHDRMVIAYAMRLSHHLYPYIKQKEQKADYTIKAVGPIQALEKAQPAIDQFALSFELHNALLLNRLDR